MEFIDLKGRKYLKSETVKKIKEKMEHNDRKLSLEHLFAIILYCDITKLCTAFSATFRRENVFESLESVISRHSKFANFGRLLVELITWFGVSRKDHLWNGNGAEDEESGPFYCGVNCVLNIGSFAISFKGPCSTSTVKPVAVNFAKSDGMILKLSNEVGDGWKGGWKGSC